MCTTYGFIPHVPTFSGGALRSVFWALWCLLCSTWPWQRVPCLKGARRGGEVSQQRKPKQWSSWGKLRGVYPSCLCAKGAGRLEIGNSGVKHLQLFIHDMMLGTQCLSMQLLQCSSSLGFARTGYLRIIHTCTSHILSKTDLNTCNGAITNVETTAVFFKVPEKLPSFLEEVPVPGTNAWKRPGAMLKRQCFWCWGAIFGQPCRWDGIGIKTKTLRNVPKRSSMSQIAGLKIERERARIWCNLAGNKLKLIGWFYSKAGSKDCIHLKL